MKEIKITINKDGNFVAEAQNYKGTSCEKDINKIVSEVGATIESSENKPEYYEQETNENLGNL